MERKGLCSYACRLAAFDLANKFTNEGKRKTPMLMLHAVRLTSVVEAGGHFNLPSLVFSLRCESPLCNSPRHGSSYSQQFVFSPNRENLSTRQPLLMVVNELYGSRRKISTTSHRGRLACRLLRKSY